MLIHCKKILKPLSAGSDPFVEVLGQTPSSGNLTFGPNYFYLKRGDYYYAVYNQSPDYGTNSTAVSTLNYIAKTQDFVNWTGSGIGSGYTYYDEIADSFFSVTLGLNYQTSMAAYHITKINPDTFSYVTTTIMGDTALSATSRTITPIQRVGNYLMFHFYRDKTTMWTCYSSNNGANWNSTKLYTINSFGLGGYGRPIASDGTKIVASGYFGSSSMTYRCFTSPTASVVSNSKCIYSDKTVFTKGTKLFYVNNSQKTLAVTTDGINDTLYPIKANSALNYGIFYENYFITTYSGALSSNYEHIGQIVVYDLNTSKMYIFNHQLNIVYTTQSGSTTYYYGTLRITGFIDNYVYFSYQNARRTGYYVARVPILHLLENLELHEYTN